MVDYLIEIIFSSIKINWIGFLLKYLSGNGKKIMNYYFTRDFVDIDWKDEKSIEKVFHENKNFGLFITLKELKKNDICLPNCGIAIYKENDEINLEINFQLSDLHDELIDDLTAKLMRLAKYISVNFQVNDYFLRFGTC